MAERPAIERAFLQACRGELKALKPGNVHVFAGGHNMTVADFEAAAAAAAPHIAASGNSVGARIEAAMRASWQAVGQNANLGIILLCAPLAAAAEALPRAGDADRLRGQLGLVLSGLSIGDAECAFRAIALANPGGLGDAPAADVRSPPTVSLLEAMRLASHRDRIAYQYVSNYEDIFQTGLKAYADGSQRFEDGSRAVSHLYMHLLAAIPDTHIARKFGEHRAATVKSRAEAVLAESADLTGEAAHARLLAFDADLKGGNTNPGTTADLTVATLFGAALTETQQEPL